MDAQNTLKPLKKSSAIIMLYPPNSTQSTYRTLLLKRKSTMSFRNSYVFPGGSCDQSDIKLAKSASFQQYSKITGLRQFLEESGLLLYPSSKQKYVIDLRLQGKSLKQVCGEIGNIWVGALGLVEPVLRLMTPQIEKGKRFDCIFHICRINKNLKVLNFTYLKTKFQVLKQLSPERYIDQFIHCNDLDKTEILFDKNESDSAVLQTPANILQSYTQKKIQLAPPQIITFTCLINLCSSQHEKQLSRFSSNPAQNYYKDIEPVMFNFDIKNRRLRLFGDQDYGHEKIKQSQPETESKKDILRYFESKLRSGQVHSENTKKRQITLQQNVKLFTNYGQIEGKHLFSFLILSQQQNKPKL